VALRKGVFPVAVVNSGSVLVAVSEYGEFSALMELCRPLSVQLSLHPVFVFSTDYGLVKEHGQLVELENWSWVQLGRRWQSMHTELDQRSDGGYRRVFEVSGSNQAIKPSMWLDGICRLFIKSGYAFLLAIRLSRRLLNDGDKLRHSERIFPEKILKKHLNHARKIFDVVNPKLVISGQDYALSVTSLLSKVASERGVRTAIVPYSMPPTTREIIESFAYLDFNRLRKWEVRLACALNPKWVNMRRGQAYSRLNLISALASDRLELTPPEPWLPNSGRGVVLVPSQKSYEYYRQAGIPETQLRLTGAGWSDHLVRGANTVAQRKEKLLTRIRSMLSGLGRSRSYIYESLKNNPNLVIISWPPNQWPRKAVGCESYADLCQQFVSAMSQIQTAGLASVAVSLHPTLTDMSLIDSLNKAGLFILRSSLLKYVDCANIFISTVSSTSFWALQCNVPTINFDGYLYGYTEFEDAGAVTVRTAQAAYEISEKLLEDSDYLKKTKEAIAANTSGFTMADGDSMKRILDTLASLALPK